MNADYWQGRLNEALEKGRKAKTPRTCVAYLELAAHYRSMAELAQRHELHPQGTASGPRRAARVEFAAVGRVPRLSVKTKSATA